MSGQEQILINELLRARIIQTEYEGLDENNIKRKYMLETGNADRTEEYWACHTLGGGLMIMLQL